jgi:hypothetical protein
MSATGEGFAKSARHGNIAATLKGHEPETRVKIVLNKYAMMIDR